MSQIEDPEEIIKDVTENARILLISIDRRIHLKLEQEGCIYPFKNVDSFATIKEAELFFSDNPESLKQYTIIIVDEFINKHYLNNCLSNYSTVATIGTHKIANVDSFVFKLGDYKKTSCDTSDKFTSYFSRDISQYIIWYIHERKCLKKSPLPTKLEELRILIASNDLSKVDEHSNLNITYGNLRDIIEDSDPYDIIILDNKQDMSDVAFLLNREKRRKTLLATFYKEMSYYYDRTNLQEKFPEYIRIYFQFAGSDINDSNIQTEELFVLLDIYDDPVAASKKATLEAIASIYNWFIPLQGFTLKEPEDYTTEMEEAKQIVYT